MPDLSTSYRTHTCGDLRREHVPPIEVEREPRWTVTLAGFVDHRLSHTTLVLRDSYGKTMVSLAAGAPAKVGQAIKELKLETVVQVTGVPTLRPDPDPEPDPKNPTGEVWLRVRKVEILCASEPLPEGILTDPPSQIPFEEKLAFRPLYLRRLDMQERLRFRDKVVHETREYLLAQGFIELETPHLFWYDRVAIASEQIPVPGGKAFALPSGALVFDQYINAGGFDRFFQFQRITRREANPTPLHQEEHTLLDINLAFADMPDFFTLIEGLITHVWKACLGEDLKTPFPRFTYAEAMTRFGTDKVDLRYTLDVEEVPGGPAGTASRALRIPGGAQKLRDADLSDLILGATGGASIAWVRVGADGALTGPGLPLFEARKGAIAQLKAVAGDLVILVTSTDADAASAAAGAARTRIAQRLDLIDRTRHEGCWVHSYPYLARDGEHYYPNVAIFSHPLEEDMEILFEGGPEKRHLIRAKAFDLVLDGVELASAYIGNHDVRVQRRIWEHVMKMMVPDLVRVRAPVEAHRFGVVPHGGMNFGFDRLVAKMLGLTAIDEVMAFPKTQACRDPFLDAPGPVPLDAVRDIVGDAPKVTGDPDADYAEEVMASA